MDVRVDTIAAGSGRIAGKPEVILSWRYQALALIELFRAIFVFGKLPNNRLLGTHEQNAPADTGLQESLNQEHTAWASGVIRGRRTDAGRPSLSIGILQKVCRRL
jgi:hypothetical protein